MSRKLGAIQFDFRNFDPIKYQTTHPSASWRVFVPYQRQWAGAVWLEIDHKSAGEALIPADELIEWWLHWKEKPNILPRLEAVHIGDLALSNIRRVIFIRSRDDGEFHEFDLKTFDHPRYEALLPEWREDFEFASLPFHEQFGRRVR